MSFSEYISFFFSNITGTTTLTLLLLHVVLILYVFGMFLVPVLYLVTSLVCMSFLKKHSKVNPSLAFIPCFGIGKTGAAAGFPVFGWICAVILTATEGIWFAFSILMALFTMGLLGTAMDTFFINSMAPVVVILLALILRIIFGVRLHLAGKKQTVVGKEAAV